MNIEEKLDIIIDLLKGLSVLVTQSDMPLCNYTLRQWFEEWIRLYKVKNIKEITIYQLEKRMFKYVIPFLGEEKLNSVSSHRLLQLLNDIESPRTKEHIYVHLNDMFDKAYKLRYISYNPMLAVTKPKHDKKQSKAMTVQEQSIFEKECQKDEYCDIFMIMLFAGLRRGEALALEYCDIDLCNRLIAVTKSINDSGNVGTPKTKTSFRKVPIFDNLMPYVTTYKKNSKSRIFPISTTRLNVHFHEILLNAGLEEKGYTIHSLRHTFATRCNENGVNPKFVQKMLGHANLDMTLNTYTHVNKDFEDSEVLKFNERLKSDEIKR